MLNILKDVSRRWICTHPAIIRNRVDVVNNLPYIITSLRYLFIDKTKERILEVDEKVADQVNEIQRSVPPNMYLQVDVDCFECQVQSYLHPELKDGPLVIVGTKPLQKIYGIDYAARSYGVRKSDTVDTAKFKCPNLKVFEPDDGSRNEHYRFRDDMQLSIETFLTEEMSDRVLMFMKHFEEVTLNIAEEVDEILSRPSGFTKFPDNPWTDNTKWILRSDNDEKLYNDEEDIKRLQIGANILAEILRRLESDTGLYASGSVACSSYIAKLACHLNKPRGITVVTSNGLEQFFSQVKIENAPGLKGKRGQYIKDNRTKADGSKMETLHDLMLSHRSREEIIEKFSKYFNERW